MNKGSIYTRMPLIRRGLVQARRRCGLRHDGHQLASWLRHSPCMTNYLQRDSLVESEFSSRLTLQDPSLRRQGHRFFFSKLGPVPSSRQVVLTPFPFPPFSDLPLGFHSPPKIQLGVWVALWAVLGRASVADALLRII